MKAIDSGKDKVKKICDILRHETLEPAKEEAKKIVEEGVREAERKIAIAKEEIEKMRSLAVKRIEEERNVFEASLNLAVKKSLEMLKHQILHELFDPEVTSVVKKVADSSDVAASFATALVAALEKEGTRGSLELVLGEHLSKEAVAEALAKKGLKRLVDGGVTVGKFAGGIQIRIADDHLTLDMTEATLKALLSNFVREDFRAIVLA